MTSSFRFLSVHDATSILCICNLFLPLLVALVEVDVVATPLVVAVVDDVAICPSSTGLMSSGEAGVLTPTPSGLVEGLKIWIGDPQPKRAIILTYTCPTGCCR